MLDEAGALNSYVRSIFERDGIAAHVAVHERGDRDHVLTAVVNNYITKNQMPGVYRIKLLHDNAPAHRSVSDQAYLEKQSIEVLRHPAYSPDIFPMTFV
jgi:hypothetical protein